MCGIIAIAGNKAENTEDAVLDRMLSCLSKRGPDDRGFKRFSNAILGHTRLSIVDLSPSGRQPMKDGKSPFTVVFNGEIYGYKDLRVRLEKLGHAFHSASDTEVILKAYAEYGKDCVEHLDGMFAFAIWDESKRELFIARDRFGKKPFYYAFIENTFYGASEIKSLTTTGIMRGKIDIAAVDDFLRLLYIPPYKTIYSNIHTLPPAHAGILKNGELKIWRYWKLEKKRLNVSYDDARLEVKRLFDEAVKKRMVADVEIGALLSGGVDSTAVTAYAAKYSPVPIKTFSVGYDHASELPHAKTASDKLGTDHYTLNAKGADINELKEVIAYFDEPHADSSDFPQHLVSKLAASKVKVALSGDGADELFMGYGWYQKYWHTPILKRIFKNPYSSYREMTDVFSKSERKALLMKRADSDASYEKRILNEHRDPYERINAFDLNIYLPGQLLMKVDGTAMMHSLEVRCPFLDTDLAEYVYSLPLKFKLSKTKSKIILKDILEETMPREFVHRRKQGFGAPLKEWLADETVKKEVENILNNEKHIVFSYLNRHKVLIAFAEADTDRNSAQKAWSLLSLALWLDLHRNEYE